MKYVHPSLNLRQIIDPAHTNPKRQRGPALDVFNVTHPGQRFTVFIGMVNTSIHL